MLSPESLNLDATAVLELQVCNATPHSCGTEDGARGFMSVSRQPYQRSYVRGHKDPHLKSASVLKLGVSHLSFHSEHSLFNKVLNIDLG